MSYVSDFSLGKDYKMIFNFTAVLFFGQKVNECTEEQQCKFSLAGGYLRNLSPVEVSGSLDLYRVRISFGILSVVHLEGKGEVVFSQPPHSLTVHVE